MSDATTVCSSIDEQADDCSDDGSDDPCRAEPAIFRIITEERIGTLRSQVGQLDEILEAKAHFFPLLVFEPSAIKRQLDHFLGCGDLGGHAKSIGHGLRDGHDRRVAPRLRFR